MIKFPEALLNQLKKTANFDDSAFLEAHQANRLITSLRLNPFKKVGLDFDLNDPVAWNNEGFYLNERPYFTHDPLFHAGAYYVQEAGSMFLEQALTQSLDLQGDLKVLDLCAAPGGKS
ncbi:MAG: Fmu (Sun) domain protein, partial [Bacteroidota bacterium]